MRGTQNSATFHDFWLVDPGRQAEKAQFTCQNADVKANQLIESLPHKWNPRKDTPSSPSAGNTSQDEDDELFDPRFNEETTLAGMFRIFCEGEACEETYQQSKEEIEYDDNPVYTDGSASFSATEGQHAGAGIYFGPGDPRNSAIRVPSTMNQTNQVAEMLAVRELAKRLSKTKCVKIISDSKYVINAVTEHYKRWEDKGYLLCDNASLIESTIAQLRLREGKTWMRWVKGHSGVEGNEQADTLAAEGATSRQTRMSDRIAPSLKIRGAKLETLSQAEMYRIIKNKKMNKATDKINRKATIANLALATSDASRRGNRFVSEEHIWRSLKSKEFSKPVRHFLWMLIHNGYSVGDYWEGKPGFEDRVKCKKCGVVEDMTHILTKCEFNGQREVWRLMNVPWKKRSGKVFQPSTQAIMSCGVLPPNPEKNKYLKAGERLRRILISEAAFLIWKLRNERVINGEAEKSEREITNKWKHAIKRRYELDKLMSNSQKFGRKAIDSDLVMDTWSGSFEWSGDIIVGENGVLVGIG